MFTWIQQPKRPYPKKKNKRESTRRLTTGLFLLRCKELGLSIDELETMDFGVVADMMTEKQNDEYKYPFKATQEDFNKF